MTYNSTPPSPKSTKKFLARLGRESKEPKLRLLTDLQTQFDEEGSSPAWRILYITIIILGLLSLAVLMGCGAQIKSIDGPTISWAQPGCGTADTPEDCGRQVRRLFDLTRHAFEKSTGKHIPDTAWSKLTRVDFTKTSVLCPDQDPFSSYPSSRANTSTPLGSLGEPGGPSGWSGPDRRCNGLMIPEGDGHYRVVVKDATCLPVTSLAHEFIHLFHRLAYGMSDIGHTRRDLICAPEDGPAGCDLNSAQRRAEAAAVAEGMCGE